MAFLEKMRARRPLLTSARLSDVGRRRLANEDATHADERLGLFVLADGLGGQPSGEAASQIITHALPHVVRHHLRRLNHLDAAVLEQVLITALQEMNTHLVTWTTAIPPLRGMAATVVGALVDAGQAHVFHAGDSRAFLWRGGALQLLTRDHTEMTLAPMAREVAAGASPEALERRLLVQFMGREGLVQPACTVVPLEPGDRLLLCSDGLTDPVSPEQIAGALAGNPEPCEACRSLVDLANAHGGPDNITVWVIDYAGVGDPGQMPVPPSAARQAEPPKGAAAAAYAALRALEVDLAWLLEGAEACALEDRAAALAAAQTRLGTPNFEKFLRRQPDQNPAHVYHQFLVAPGSSWRNQYERHLAELTPSLQDLCAGTLRLSPILTREEAAGIIASLWRDWQRVEQMYFLRCQRGVAREGDHSLNYLLGHMLQSVRTLAGLIAFLPRFMRELGMAGASGSHVPQGA